MLPSWNRYKKYIDITQVQKKYANDGFFNISQESNHDVDNDVVSIGSQINSMDDDNDVEDDD